MLRVRWIVVMVVATVLTTAGVDSSVAAEPAALVPKPAKVEWLNGKHTLDAATQIIYREDAAKTEAETLAALLRPATGLALPVKPMPASAGNLNNVIVLAFDADAEAPLGKEGYRLLVEPARYAQITAASAAGLFYGGQTLRQLLPPAVFAKTKQEGVKWEMPCCRIEDKPRFAWRGLMLDYSRHFFDVAYTKHLLDAMAMHKLNVLHMHLADDEGWRVEIKKYPKLTEIGAWRGTACKLPNRSGEKFARYGGFFTQDDIREIVAYAAKLHINVMPEVDLPGHSLAICTAYPETLPTEGTGSKGVRRRSGNVISPADEATYAMIDDIYGELAAIFPFDYVHVGGDEVNHNAWKDAPEVKQLIEREKIDSLHGVQVYFTKRLETILAKHKKQMIGWNEILNEKLERSTGIMSWTGVGPGYQAVRMGFPVVMAASPHYYFDMGYPDAVDEPPAMYWAGAIDARRCYAFDPLGERGLTSEQAQRIKGVEACLWAEFVTPWKATNGWLDLKTGGEAADYKFFPRACALAEAGWTPQESRDYSEFADRLAPSHLERLKNAGVIFRVAPPQAVAWQGSIRIQPPFAGAEVRYSLDGSDPIDSTTAIRWDRQPIAGKPAGFRARAFFDGIPSPLHIGARTDRSGDKSDFLKPPAKVSTTINAYEDHTPDKMVDYDRGTFFWSDRGLRKGEKVTVTFAEPVVLSSIESVTGKPEETGRDILTAGVLEVSGDGTAFRKVADFVDGTATAELKKENIKAIRITATADTGANWVVFQDLYLK